MKKIVALILAFTMALALAACGSKSENKEPSVLGDWEDDAGNYLTFSDGGIGKFTNVYNDSYSASFTYELKDGVITIQYQKWVVFSKEEAHASFKMNEDGTKLVSTLGSDGDFTESGKEYIKWDDGKPHSGPKFIATITTKSGATEKMSAKQVSDLYNDNWALFNSDYYGAKVVLEGKVNKIGGGLSLDGHSMIGYIEIDDGSGFDWWVEVEKRDILNQLQIGDTVRVTGQIYEARIHVHVFSMNGWKTTVEIVG